MDWLDIFGFELVWGKEVESAVEALAIVAGLNVIKDGGLGLGVRGEVTSVDEFDFEGAPEAFHGGVVVAVALPAHGRKELGLGQSGSKISGGVLDTAIGVEEQLGSWLAVLERHVERGHDQRGVDPFAHGPTDDLSAVKVKDAGEVKPTFLGLDVGDVGDPDLIGCRGRWSLRQAIGHDGVVVVAVGGLDAVAALLAAAEASLTHEAGDSLTSMTMPAGPQFPDDSGTAIGLACLVSGGTDSPTRKSAVPGAPVFQPAGGGYCGREGNGGCGRTIRSLGGI